MNCALFRAHIICFLATPEVSLILIDDDLQNYLTAPELCHLPPHTVH